MEPNSSAEHKLPIRYVVFSILLIWLIVVGIWYWARDPAPVPAGGEGPAEVQPTFTIFDLGADAELDRGVRRALSKTLGNEALLDHSPVDIAIFYPGFVETHFAVLADLNRQLNPVYGQRRQLNTRKLSYRYITDKSSAVSQAHFLFSGFTQRPLWFTVRLSAEGATLLEELAGKYGPPRLIEGANSPWTIRYWQRDEDLLLIGSRPDGNGRPRFTLELFFVQNLKRFAERETETRRRQQEARERQVRQLM